MHPNGRCSPRSFLSRHPHTLRNQSPAWPILSLYYWVLLINSNKSYCFLSNLSFSQRCFNQRFGSLSFTFFFLGFFRLWFWGIRLWILWLFVIFIWGFSCLVCFNFIFLNEGLENESEIWIGFCLFFRNHLKRRIFDFFFLMGFSLFSFADFVDWDEHGLRAWCNSGGGDWKSVGFS